MNIIYNAFISKPGNRTAGTDKESLDGINLIFFVKLAKASGKYKHVRIT